MALSLSQQAAITARANWIENARRPPAAKDGDTALAAARKALELLSIGLIAAGLKRLDP